MNPAIWQAIGIFSTVLALVLLGLFLWRRREERREHAIETAGTMSAWGLDLFAKLFRAYAVGNYIGKDSVARVLREIVGIIKDDGVPAALNRAFWKLLEHHAGNEDSRAKIQQVLDDKASAVARKTATPVPSDD